MALKVIGRASSLTFFVSVFVVLTLLITPGRVSGSTGALAQSR